MSVGSQKFSVKEITFGFEGEDSGKVEISVKRNSNDAEIFEVDEEFQESGDGEPELEISFSFPVRSTDKNIAIEESGYDEGERWIAKVSKLEKEQLFSFEHDLELAAQALGRKEMSFYCSCLNTGFHTSDPIPLNLITIGTELRAIDFYPEPESNFYYEGLQGYSFSLSDEFIQGMEGYVEMSRSNENLLGLGQLIVFFTGGIFGASFPNILGKSGNKNSN